MDAGMGDSYEYYWETQHYLECEELVSSMYVGGGAGACEDAMSYYDSSSPDGSHSSSAAPAGTGSAAAGGAAGGNKNIIMERYRRRKLNKKLYTLRSVVPDITKVRELNPPALPGMVLSPEGFDDERPCCRWTRSRSSRTRSSTSSACRRRSGRCCRRCARSRPPRRHGGAGENYYGGHDEGFLAQAERRKKMRRADSVPSIAHGTTGASLAPVEVLELCVSEAGDRVLVVSVTCSKRRDAMARVCRAIEELCLRVITASVTSVAGCLMHTVFVEVDEMDCIQMKEMVEAALSQLDDAPPASSMSY